MRECPKCGRELQHQEADPDAGIQGLWFCPACDYDEDDTDDYDESDINTTVI